MKNKIFGSLLFLPIITLGGYMIYLSSMVHFQKVEIAVEGYDPKDFFAGYYLSLRPNWQKTDCRQFISGVCPRQDFAASYNFYIKAKQSVKLSKAVDAGGVKLVFSYSPGKKPMIIDLKIEDQSYLKYLQER